ncbi:uncharacterized protein [Rutidosis leptorrhynchoides]|uniref:uncharacterized protein n=1 Tax=Rutidosis leptorrhynchoides TaxID=125765 RepID=UPI003A999E71
MERMEQLLYEASLEGNVTNLLNLIQEDPLILERQITLNINGDMPLHIASMLGHTDFVTEILTRNPNLSSECDSQKHLPLHIASAKGHLEIVKALVSANVETCSARDRDGRNPLHIAAIRGRCEVVKQLLRAQPHAARALVQQETVLHLCVKYNQLEVLKLLIESMGDHEFVNSKDAYGNTILHLAVADKQIQTINFLLLDTPIEVNATNTKGETARDILSQVSRDLTYHQIMQSLERAGATESKPHGSFGHNSRKKLHFNRLDYQQNQPTSSHAQKFDDWLDKKRSSLMVVASLIATMAFQAGTNPPSGVWQDNSPDATDELHKAGYAIMVSNQPTLYPIFLICNTVGFISSLSIIVLLISGLPFSKNRFFMWILMVIMWIATSSISLTYMVSIWVLTPASVSESIFYITRAILVVWIVLMTLVLVGHTINLILISLRGLRRLLFPKKRQVFVPIVMNHAEM